MTIDIAGLGTRSALRRVIAQKLAAMFDGQRAQPVAARVGFVDDGPKGGAPIRCGINIERPRRPSVHVEHHAPNERLAFDGALAALEHAVARDRGRMLTERRRPKKYYLAKRLLSPDEALPDIPRKPRRRSALRRFA